MSTTRDAAGARIHDEIVEGHLQRFEGGTAPEQCAHACEQFRKMIGLRQVIIGAGVKTLTRSSSPPRAVSIRIGTAVASGPAADDRDRIH